MKPQVTYSLQYNTHLCRSISGPNFNRKLKFTCIISVHAFSHYSLFVLRYVGQVVNCLAAMVTANMDDGCDHGSLFHLLVSCETVISHDHLQEGHLQQHAVSQLI